MAKETPVYLEVGKKRVFACAFDWPGWCRSGKSEEEALERLAEYAPRYGVVAAEAGVRFPRTAGRKFEVAERVEGSGTTDFGAPGKPAQRDSEPASAAEAKRLVALVAASWRVLDEVAKRAPAELAKGPRGGGRDRDKVVQHVLGAESSYARALGVRHRGPPPQPSPGTGAGEEDREAVEAMREELERVLIETLRTGESPSKGKSWPPRYVARRVAWHVLDHAWEIEDKGGMEPRRGW
jgi:hypothetical protein